MYIKTRSDVFVSILEASNVHRSWLKNSAIASFFNSLLGVWISDETLFLVYILLPVLQTPFWIAYSMRSSVHFIPVDLDIPPFHVYMDENSSRLAGIPVAWTGTRRSSPYKRKLAISRGCRQTWDLGCPGCPGRPRSCKQALRYREDCCLIFHSDGKPSLFL